MIIPANLQGSAQTTQPLDRDWTVTWDGAETPLPARVPGYAQHDIFDAGLLPDPYPGKNEEIWQPWFEHTYTYTCAFDTNPEMLAHEHVELVFDGIDTAAEVYLDDELLGTTDNMFRTYRFKVKDRLSAGRHTVRVEIQSPTQTSEALRQKYESTSPLLELGQQKRRYLRKMPCSFGWDWGIRLPMSGLCKPVRLEGWNAPRIATVWHETMRADDTEAVVRGWVMLTDRVSQRVDVAITLTAPGGDAQRALLHIEPDTDSACFCLTVPDPELWWPNGLGEQPLYTLAVRASTPSNESAWERRIGVRALRVVREPDEFGESFYFEVNGVPVFAKGANWIPGDAILSRMSRADYERLITATRDANMNMLRVWGGGHYEHDVFYELCDEYGILVWQDVMFACSSYPSHREFLVTTGAEVRDQVTRLQHHACIALWCGNNEVEEAVTMWKRLPAETTHDYYFLFEEYIAGVVRTNDPARLYWPSSSHSSWTSNPKREDSGDTHDWRVWHGGMPFEAYLERHDRFLSEFGFQAFPDVHTVKRYAQPEDFQLESEVMNFHQRCGKGNHRIFETLKERYGVPKKFEDQLIATQVLQAEAVRLGVEHWRRNRGNQRCMGTLYWQINDNWPVASWSSIDYFGRWKALHYAARRFYAPLLVSPLVHDGRVRVTIVNDSKETRSGWLHWRVRSYTNRVVAKGSCRARIAPQDAEHALEFALADVLDGKAAEDCYLIAEWRDKRGTERVCALLTFAKDARLENPKLGVTRTATGVRVTAKRYAPAVYIDCDSDAVQFEDNYFDLVPGEEREIAAVPVKGARVDWASVGAVNARSLWHLLRNKEPVGAE